ncbi:hypothetical protein [Streptomyces sp. NPDC048489]
MIFVLHGFDRTEYHPGPSLHDGDLSSHATPTVDTYGTALRAPAT